MIRFFIALALLVGLVVASLPASPTASAESWSAGQQVAARDWRVTG